MLEFLDTFAGALLHALGQAAPYVLLGLLIAGAIREFVPSRALARHFGERGLTPVAKATGAGALVPVCSCGVIPIGVGAFHAGASRGTVLAFLTAAPALSPVAAVLAFQMLGASLALSLIVGVIVGSMALGFVANRMLGGSREVAFRQNRGLEVAAACADTPRSAEEGQRLPVGKRLGRLFYWAYVDFGTKLGAQLLIGLLLAALIIALIPPDWVQGWLGHQSIWTVLVVLLVAIPIYTCSVPSIAVVYSLLLLGMSPGAAVAFLIAGPATNLAELNAVRGQLGTATAGLYLLGLVTVAVAAGVATDQLVFPDYEYQMSMVEGEMVVESCCVPIGDGTESLNRSTSEMVTQVPAWHYPFLVLLLPILLIGVVNLMRGKGGKHGCTSSEPHGAAKPSCCSSSTGAGAHDESGSAEHEEHEREHDVPRYRPSQSHDSTEAP